MFQGFDVDLEVESGLSVALDTGTASAKVLKSESISLILVIRSLQDSERQVS